MRAVHASLLATAIQPSTRFHSKRYQNIGFQGSISHIITLVRKFKEINQKFKRKFLNKHRTQQELSDNVENQKQTGCISVPFSRL